MSMREGRERGEIREVYSEGRREREGVRRRRGEEK